MLEPHVRSVERRLRQRISHLGDGFRPGRMSGLRGEGGEYPGHFRADNGRELLESQVLRRLQCRSRLVKGRTSTRSGTRRYSPVPDLR